MNKINNKKIDASKKQQIDMAMHCDEVQEVMGEIPSWIVRWGITVIFAIVVALIIGSHFFYYPDVVKTDIRITTDASMKSIGEVKIPAAGSGRIKTDQKVNVFIANYPYSEYGYVTGVIDCIDETPDENGNYLITVAFPNGMKSSYGHNLRAWKVMTGTAEIIIENKRLTEKLLQPFNLIKR